MHPTDYNLCYQGRIKVNHSKEPLSKLIQDLRSAAIYSAFLTRNSDIHTTSSVFT